MLVDAAKGLRVLSDEELKLLDLAGLDELCGRLVYILVE